MARSFVLLAALLVHAMLAIQKESHVDFQGSHTNETGSDSEDLYAMKTGQLSPFPSPSHGLPNKSLPIALVHVGPHKTGSTHIQNILGYHPETLRSMNIVYPVPPSAGRTQAAHHFLFRCLNNKSQDDDAERTDMFWQATENASAHHHNLIISSEMGRNLELPGMRKMQEKLSPFDVHIVFFYRNILSWLYSDYRQQLWTRQERGLFSDFYEREYVDLHSQLFGHFENYVQNFGRGHVRAVDYEGAQSNGDIVNAMLSAAPLPVFDHEILAKTLLTVADNIGIGHEEIILRQLWVMFEEHLVLHENCTLMWPTDPLAMLVDMPEIIFVESSIPTKCMDVKPLKDKALSVDKAFRAQFQDLILFGREDLVQLDIANFASPCELDRQAVKNDIAAWQHTFERQFLALPHDACLPGDLGSPKWSPHH